MRDDGTRSTREVAELARVSYRQLDHWVASGLLVIGDVSPGSGTRRRWTPDETTHARLFAALVHAGVTPQAVADAMPSALVGPRTFRLDLGDVVVTGPLP
jgi:DNA-binding transcriptional MerR regulator